MVSSEDVKKWKTELSDLCFIPFYKERKHDVEDAIARMGLTGKVELYHIVFTLGDNRTLPTEHLAFKPIDEKLIFMYSLKGWDKLVDEIVAETDRNKPANGR